MKAATTFAVVLPVRNELRQRQITLIYLLLVAAQRGRAHDVHGLLGIIFLKDWPDILRDLSDPQ